MRIPSILRGIEWARRLRGCRGRTGGSQLRAWLGIPVATGVATLSDSINPFRSTPRLYARGAASLVSSSVVLFTPCTVEGGGHSSGNGMGPLWQLQLEFAVDR